MINVYPECNNNASQAAYLAHAALGVAVECYIPLAGGCRVLPGECPQPAGLGSPRGPQAGWDSRAGSEEHKPQGAEGPAHHLHKHTAQTVAY